MTKCIVGVSVAPSQFAGELYQKFRVAERGDPRLAAGRLQRSIGSPPDEAIPGLRFVLIVILVAGPLQAQAPATAAVLGMDDFIEDNDVRCQRFSMRQMYNIFSMSNMAGKAPFPNTIKSIIVFKTGVERCCRFRSQNRR